MDYIPDEPRKTEPLIPTKKKGLVREYGEALFWAILFAFLIRSFLFLRQKERGAPGGGAAR